MANILLIESKQSDCEIFTLLFSRMDIPLVTKRNLEEAYLYLMNKDDFSVDAILISTEIINKDYIDFMNWIKKIHSEINVVATTCRPSDQEVCEKCGVTFFPKPIMDVCDLAQILKN